MVAAGPGKEGLTTTSLLTVGTGAERSGGRLDARGLNIGYSGWTVLDGLGLAIPTGSCTVLVGSGACKKPALPRSRARLLPPRSGQVLLDGDDTGVPRPRAQGAVAHDDAS
ncbi:hypothetical protein [Streptosporangium sp. NPDC049644]|uniref:hypothetical protein n=1 Tax=Streptosporangium sp. NPDC049644 TaxID=3155507 RepID=UPI0034286398